MNNNEERIRDLLGQLYPADLVQAAYTQILSMAAPARPVNPSTYFSERTVTLITYGDTLRQDGEMPLRTLHRFLNRWLKGYVDTVHILPFYPYSSDDGFSVIDYYAVAPDFGDWQDITALSADFRLMSDAVINHMSARSPWFQKFLAGDPDFQGMFLTQAPGVDLGLVTRPRTSPLLTPFARANGQTAHVWTTFSDDQVDLDYRDPRTLIRILDVLLFYVAKGAQVIRLDAIAFLWKQAGTSCVHLPQTHTMIQLIRAVLDVLAPHVILITETNVPHPENIAYLGDGTNEAQLVYNFTLLLHTLISGKASLLKPFGCQISVYDPWLVDGYLRTQGVEPVSLEQLMETSKVIFVLTATTTENRALLSRDLLERIQPGAVLVMISRAHVVDFDARTELVCAGHFKAALDVFPTEPMPLDHPIRQAQDAVLSAHRAGPVVEALWEIGEMVIDDLDAITQGLPPQRRQVAQPELIARYLTNTIKKAPVDVK